MSQKQLPAIILTSNYRVGSSKGKSYKKFVDYISTDKDSNEYKEQDTKKEYLSQNYLDYISINKLKSDSDYNKENAIKRTTSSFNEDEFIGKEQMNQLKEKFKKADEKNHVMYQDIISFDNQFLIDNQLYNEDLDKLDESKVKNATRKMMRKMIEDNNMDKENTFWCANIHYDTDNIHIHIASSEEENTREVIQSGKYEGQFKGKRRKKTINNMKSTFANSIYKDINLMKEIDQVKKEIKEKAKERTKTSKLDIHSLKNLIQQKRDYKDLVEKLPPTNQSWAYNSEKIKPIQKDIDQYIEKYVAPYYKESEDKLEELLDKQTKNYKRLYGENSNYEDYKENKKERIKSDIGNAFLKELKNIEKDKQYDNFNKEKKKTYSQIKSKNQMKQAMGIFKKSAYKLSKRTARKRDDYIHELEHQKLERNIQKDLQEQENQMDM
ncbi:MobP2 family relaxase [Staphylococcus caprae]|uniref:MobP2 family relaxase n=1 Tax=Staphylococcus caprae TaxID=29380 RepID=UPI000CD07852|nr:MobP2 family relaxase [Staphylococcus caprae]POA06091.1 hypothetical protein CD155_03865 [Staphylococcus caprae]SUL89819.1 Uncharacterised protein [Staphylococcus caprae]